MKQASVFIFKGVFLRCIHVDMQQGETYAQVGKRILRKLGDGYAVECGGKFKNINGKIIKIC